MQIDKRELINCSNKENIKEYCLKLSHTDIYELGDIPNAFIILFLYLGTSHFVLVLELQWCHRHDQATSTRRVYIDLFVKYVNIMCTRISDPFAKILMQSNPGWGFDKKCQFMDKLVWDVSQHYK